MNFAETLMTKRQSLMVEPRMVKVDKVGIGKGVCDILARQWQDWQGTNVGDKLPDGSMDEELYFNLRAKIYWKERQWILGGGKLLVTSDQDKEDWLQLSKIKYRHKLEGTRGKIQIMPKEIMLKDGIPSPDVADALSLTFVDDEQVISAAEVNRIVQTAEIKNFGRY